MVDGYEHTGMMQTEIVQITDGDIDVTGSPVSSEDNAVIDAGSFSLDRVSYIIEGFEDYDPGGSEQLTDVYGVDTSWASIETSTVFEGDQALLMESGDDFRHQIVSMSGLDYYPQSDVPFEVFVEVNSDAEAQFMWAVQSEKFDPDCYSIALRPSGRCRLNKISNESWETLDDISSPNIPADEKMRVAVHPWDDGTVAVDVYDSTDSLIHSLSATDNSPYGNGGLGCSTRDDSGGSGAPQAIYDGCHFQEGGGTGNSESGSAGMQLLADGAWDGDSNPHVLYDATADVTFFSGAGANGDVTVAGFDHGDGSVETNVVKSYSGASDHQYAAITIRDDGRVQVFYAEHLGDHPIYSRISDNARDISSFGTEFQVGGSAAGDYPNVAKNAADGIMFWRGDNNDNKDVRYAETSDDGDTWTGDNRFYQVSSSNLYPNVASEDGSSIVHLAGECLDTSAGTYVGYDFIFYAKIDLSTGDVMQADGTSIGTLSDTPFGEADLEKAYSEATDGYEARVDSLELDANGNPVIGIQRRDPDAISSSDAGDHAVVWFDGSAWQSSVVTSAGHPIRDSEAGGIAVDPTDTDVVYVGVGISGDDVDVYRYTSPDGKDSWSEDATIVANGDENIRPLVPRARQDDLAVLWMQGRYDALDDYATDVRGASY